MSSADNTNISFTKDMIDWSKVAEPRADGYDLEAVRALMRDHPMPWHSVDAACDQVPLPGTPTVMNGQVSIGFDGEPLLPAPRFQPLDTVPPLLLQAVEIIKCWPEMSAEWPRLVWNIQPFEDTGLSEGRSRLGSCSHNESARFGVIGLTANSALGAAQAIVHEAAHHKLRALGVDNEASENFILNSGEDHFFSPVVGVERPMTALLHAYYSFIHIAELDLRMLDAFPEFRADIMELLVRNTPRLAEYYDTIKKSAELDAAGEAFVGELHRWTERVFVKIGHLKRQTV